MASHKDASKTMTSAEVRDLLRSASAKLSAREEKVVRMLTGSALPKSRPLSWRGQQNPDARAELLALEIELMQKLQQRARPAKAKAAAQPVRTKEKEKIIRALKRMK
jgi:hypothetical protein